MKKILILIAFISLFLPGISNAGSSAGEPGSKIDSQLGQITVEFQKADLTYVTVYTGSTYVEMIGTAGQQFAASILANLPPDGTYIGFRFTAPSIKKKVKLVLGGTTYYSTLQTINQGSPTPWAFSTNVANYDYVTYNFTVPGSLAGGFPLPLTINSALDSSIVVVNETSGNVTYDWATSAGNINDVTYAGEEDIVSAMLTANPTKKVQFDITSSPAGTSNKVTLFYDSANNFIGGSCSAPALWALNSRSLLSGTSTYGSNFNLVFRDGDGRGSFNVSGNYTCGGYTGLAVTLTTTTPPGPATNYPALSTTGTVTCTAL